LSLRQGSADAWFDAGQGKLSVDQPRRRWAASPDPLDGEQQPTVEGVLRDLKRVPLARLIATALIIIWAILFARYSWEAPVNLPVIGKTIPIATDAERALFDWRQSVGEPRVQEDKRILLVPYVQDTLRATAKRSPLDRAILAQALTNLDGMGAKAIGIDILIDQPQPEDPQLFASLKAMKTPVWIAYANRQTAMLEIEQWQQQFMDNWFSQLAGSQVRPHPFASKPTATMSFAAGQAFPQDFRPSCRWPWQERVPALHMKEVWSFVLRRARTAMSFQASRSTCSRTRPRLPCLRTRFGVARSLSAANLPIATSSRFPPAGWAGLP
jgi:hypothetical protein